MNDIVFLINQDFELDEDGNHVSKNTEKKIFAKAESIYGKEFFEARQNGLKTEFKLVVWSHEYNGEKLVRYNGIVYDIYRTFKNNDFTELYLSEKVGV